MDRKTRFLFPSIFILGLLATGCKPSRVWSTKKKENNEKETPIVNNRPPVAQPAPPPPRYYNATPLLIIPTPGFVMKQDRDGRFFHRTPQGLLYWKGYDNRFYLDSYYLAQVSYRTNEYNDWNSYRRASR
jgi:hypothetical protein